MELGNLRKPDSNQILYQVPWICYEHSYLTMDKMQFFSEHMMQVKHYHHGSNGTCESCGKYLLTWVALFRGLSEPTIILCDSCKDIPNIIRIIRDRRKGVYPLLELEQDSPYDNEL